MPGKMFDRTRRSFIQGCSALTLGLVPVLESRAYGADSLMNERGPAQGVSSLNEGWLFGGKAESAGAISEKWTPITLPHCVSPLSWHKWNPDTWQAKWNYTRRFVIPREWKGLRVFLHFDRAMASASPVLNGHALPAHKGGFLPFEYEITNIVREEDNLLNVEVDSNWQEIPPAGSARGVKSVDYLIPGGITGSVRLYAVPAVFLQDVFAKPVNVLRKDRQLEVSCRINAVSKLPVDARIEVKLLDKGKVVSQLSQKHVQHHAEEDVKLVLGSLENISLWEPDRPQLYDVQVTLYSGRTALHVYRTRVGFREARFEVDGFFLNGKRTRIFGLNRHELYPYVGFAAADRLQRKDAEILRTEFNCNMVRCSHYPQSEAFLNACDELGLMVWEEPPGWQYIGEEDWQKLAMQDVEAMVRRDRNHASIIIWGVRINESRNVSDLYKRTSALARSLDDSRPNSGSMTPDSRKNWQTEWQQDVFAFDDYHSAADGSVGIDEPLPGVPYMLAEAVGQYSYGGRGFSNKYRRAGDIELQMKQALFHAQAHDRAAFFSRNGGVIAWCAYDYASLMNDYEAVKCPGVADVFRIPKLGAAFYLSQVEPSVRPVIEPSFYWSFAVESSHGPGERAAIFSNCERLEVYVGGKAHSVLHADRKGFPNLKYPPFFADLKFETVPDAELRIDGYVGETKVLSRSFSADASQDRFWCKADDAELCADGSDATRIVFAVVDRHGTPRAFADGKVAFYVEGPGEIVGDNPFQLHESGGVGAVYMRTRRGVAGKIAITLEHERLGRQVVEVLSR